ncbi:MAG: hypothetical protein WBA12_08450 [Catalinimonas sp.]
MLRTELQNRTLREKQLRHELDAQQQSLTAHTLHRIQRNQSLEGVRTELLATNRGRPSQEMRRLARRIDQYLQEDQEWEDFRRIFERVHPVFLDALRRRFPDLTPAEQRLCALLRLQLDARDIATLLGISTDSLRTARYRLRKKLDLPAGEPLGPFLQRLGVTAAPAETATITE